MEEEEGETEATEAQPGEPVAEPKPSSKDDSKKEKKRRKSSQGSQKSNSLSANQQQLFLVEFLVDTVCIDSCSVDEEVLQGQTCLSLSFLNFPPMEVCEKDFNPDKQTGSNRVRFNCGKSLMFAFNEQQCERPPPLSVEITVLKKLGDDDNAVKVEIGVIKICIAELFRQIIDTAKYKPEKLPASKAIKDCFMLIGPGKRTMGEVSVYIRLSCLGQTVVTEFQCGPDLKSDPVTFKNKEGRKMFEFKGADGAAAEGGEATAEARGSISPQGGQGDGGGSPAVNATYSKGNRVILDLPGKGKNKGGECGGRGRERQEGEKPPTEVKSNPDQNVFLLKVGDKGQIPDRGKMILEFKTPKQRILPKVLPPYHEDVAVQTDSGKKKGKGGKKKK